MLSWRNVAQIVERIDSISRTSGLYRGPIGYVPLLVLLRISTVSNTNLLLQAELCGYSLRLPELVFTRFSLELCWTSAAFVFVLQLQNSEGSGVLPLK